MGRSRNVFARGAKAPTSRGPPRTSPAIAAAQRTNSRGCWPCARLESGWRNPRTIHRLRIAFKRFRYLCELLEPFLSGVTETRLERMRHYQGASGEIQDLAVLLARLERAVKKEELGGAGGNAKKHLRRNCCGDANRAIGSFPKRIDEVHDFGPAGSARAAAGNTTQNWFPHEALYSSTRRRRRTRRSGLQGKLTSAHAQGHPADQTAGAHAAADGNRARRYPDEPVDARESKTAEIVARGLKLRGKGGTHRSSHAVGQHGETGGSNKHSLCPAPGGRDAGGTRAIPERVHLAGVRRRSGGWK